MYKMDLTVEKSMTINTGNYSNVKPNVILTVKDVPMDKVSEVYEKLSLFAGELHTVELGRQVLTYDTLKGNVNTIGEVFAENLNDIKEEVERSFMELKKCLETESES